VLEQEQDLFGVQCNFLSYQVPGPTDPIPPDRFLTLRWTGA